MRFSVVVPTYNRAETLARCLEALISQNHHEYEVIVVDDGSNDNTGVMVRGRFPQVRYLRQDNRGPAVARNRGLAQATGEIIAFTDDDCVVPGHWLATLADGYRRYSEVAGVGGYLEAPEEVLQSNIFAGYEQHVAKTFYGVGETEKVGGFECPAGGTNNMSYRRSVLEEVGGFDETFPYAAGEDADLKWRVCLKGYKLLYVPVKVIHLQPYTWRSFRRQSFTRGRGRVIFDRKRGRNTGRFKVLLRLGKVKLVFLRDLMVSNERRFAAVRLTEGIYGCWGQFVESGAKEK